jgi:MarC family integral membrane protein
MVVGELISLALIASGAFLFAFPSLFSIINPIGGAFIFDSVMTRVSHDERKGIAARIGLYSLLIMFGSLWIGANLLSFFGVSLDALRIARRRGERLEPNVGWRSAFRKKELVEVVRVGERRRCKWRSFP